MDTKIFITGASPINKLNIAKLITEKNDNISIARTFTTDIKYKDIETDDYKYYLQPEEVNLAFKNNVVIYITTRDYVSSGVVIDSLYNDDVFVLSMEDFNNIPDVVFEKNNIVVVWCDTKHYDDKDERKIDIKECKYLCERLNNLPYMYFLDESNENIANVILKYIDADEDGRNEIISENC